MDFTAVLLSFSMFLISALDAQRMCPAGWISNSNSCYFTGERFNGQTYYSASAFCQGFGPGAHLVEINDALELDFVTSLVTQKSWVDGPWIGLLRPFGDRRWILPTLRMQPSNADLDKVFTGMAVSATHDCGGFDKYGRNLGFWRCRNGGSPFCEIELQ